MAMNMMQILLLQATTTVADTTQQAAQAVQAAPAPQLSLWYLLTEGGVLMIPLLLCSILAVFVFVERLLAIRKAGQMETNFMGRVRDMILSGNLAGARSMCKGSDTAIARMIDKGISRIGKPLDYIERSIENTGKVEVYKMEKNVSILSTIAGIAPMFGFLGTIAGMIILFFNVTTQGFSIESIAGGIYTKMVTSAVGLMIGLVAYVAYNYLNAQIDKNVNKMEEATNEFMDILHEPTR